MPRTHGLLYGVFVVARIDPRERDDFLARLCRKRVTYRYIRRKAVDIRIARGYATNNFARLLGSILDPEEQITAPTGATADIVNKTLVDTGGTSFSVGIRGGWSETMSGYYRTTFNVIAGYSPSRSATIGSFFMVGGGTTSPSVSDYKLASPLQTIPSSSVSISNGVITVTGGGTASGSMTVREIGIFTKVLQSMRSKYSPTVRSVLLDRAVITGVSYNAGDPIAVQYRIAPA